MTTWTQYIGVSEPNDTLSIPINKRQYEEIQADARLAGKIEGMEEVSKIPDEMRGEGESDLRCVRDRIRSAAKSLKEGK